MNIATACGLYQLKMPTMTKQHQSQYAINLFSGCLFSIAFNSVDMAIAYLVPFDVSLMITSGVFIRLK